MTNRQRAFCDHYISTGNAAQAARRAGYSERSARTTGARMLANADTKTYIAHKLEVLESQRIATADEVLQFLTDVMRGNVKDQFGLDAALSDRLKAAQELLKRFNAADAQADSLQKLDCLLLEFRAAISTGDE